MIKVFGHWIHRQTISKVVLDFFFPVACLVVAAFIWGLWERGRIEVVILYAVVFALTMVVCNAWLGLYQGAQELTLVQSRIRAVVSFCFSIPLAYGLFSLLAISNDSQEFLLLSGLAAVCGILAHRIHTVQAGSSGMMIRRVMIFGAGSAAKSVGKILKLSDPDIEIVGYYPSASDTDINPVEKLILPRTKSLSDTAFALKVDEIIIAVQERRGGALPLRELLDCKLSGVDVVDLPNYFERALGQIRLDSLRVGWLIFGEGFNQGWLRTVVKRLADILISGFLLMLTLPVIALTALLIFLEDGLPIFYRQERVGLNGRLFKILKLRSMRTNAESDGKPRWATAGDDRTTRVGRIIRKLRIDELPQLFCVLAGDMSLVGPRPERPFFVDQLTRDIPFYAVRHSVKPGVTGWAQVSFHYGASVDDAIRKLQYDLYYVKNHTLFLDLVILFETVGVVLTGKGAQ